MSTLIYSAVAFLWIIIAGGLWLLYRYVAPATSPEAANPPGTIRRASQNT